jgi:D-alanine transaminase
MSYVLINQSIIPRDQAFVSFDDRSHQFGDGIYEVVRIYNGNLFALEEHIQRFERNAREIFLSFPYTIEELIGYMKELVTRNSIQDGIVYVQMSRGSSPRNHVFPDASVKPEILGFAKPLPRPVEKLQNGVKAILTEDIRWLRCDIKTLNLLANVLAKQKAVEAGAYEAIFHRGDVVTEASASNLCIVKGGLLLTHPATNLILHGITRQIVLQLAKEIGIPVLEQAFKVEDLFAADEVFLTGTTSEVLPVTQIGIKMIADGVPGLVTRKIQAAFEQKIAANA